MAVDGKIPLRLELDGRDVRSETVYAEAGAYALTIMTTLPAAELPIELHSTYVGHPGSTTHATHLRLGPEPRSPWSNTAEHADEDICLVFTPRNAVYDHAHELVEFFEILGHRAAVHVDDGAFQTLEAIPSGDPPSVIGRRLSLLHPRERDVGRTSRGVVLEDSACRLCRRPRFP